MSQTQQLDSSRFQIVPVTTPAWVITSYHSIERVIGYLIHHDKEETSEMASHIVCGSGFILEEDNNNGTGCYPYFGPIPERDVKRCLRESLRDGCDVRDFINHLKQAGYTFINDETIRKWAKEMDNGIHFEDNERMVITDKSIVCSDEFIKIDEGSWQHKESGFILNKKDDGFYFEGLVPAEITPEIWMSTPVKTLEDFRILASTKFGES